MWMALACYVKMGCEESLMLSVIDGSVNLGVKVNGTEAVNLVKRRGYNSCCGC